MIRNYIEIEYLVLCRYRGKKKKETVMQLIVEGTGTSSEMLFPFWIFQLSPGFVSLSA